MQISVGPEISCSNCVAACCRKGTWMKLTSQEAAFLEEGGREVEPIKDLHIGERQGYEMFSDCGYLVVDKLTGVRVCSVYDDPRKPAACSELIVDSEACNYMRRGFGIPAR